MNSDTKYNIRFPRSEDSNQTARVRLSVGKNSGQKRDITDEKIFSLKASTELLNAIEDSKRFSLLLQETGDEEQQGTEVVFVDSSTFILTINGKDYQLSCQSDKYISSDVIEIPSSNTVRDRDQDQDQDQDRSDAYLSSCSYIGSIASNCRFKHHARSKVDHRPPIPATGAASTDTNFFVSISSTMIVDRDDCDSDNDDLFKIVQFLQKYY